jgi:hypothetical protein
MLTLKLENLTVRIEGCTPQDDARLLEILTRLTTIEGKVDTLMLSEQQMNDLLTRIDTTTNKTAANVQTIADVDQQISNEMDAFIAANPAGTVMTDAQITTLQALADRAQATSDASDSQVAVLQAIAAKGAPAVPPPPPTVLPPNPEPTTAP